jgi:hypothetical protein
MSRWDGRMFMRSPIFVEIRFWLSQDERFIFMYQWEKRTKA